MKELGIFEKSTKSSSSDRIIYITTTTLNILRNFKNGMVKDLHTEKKSRFTIQILYENAKLYLKYLKFINRNIYNKEKILYNATENKELISVLNIEKSLVYFITSLKENDVLIDRMEKGNVIPMYEDDLDLLEESLQQEDKNGKNRLTMRENEILNLVGKGFNNKEIGQKLFITENTVKKHVSSIFTKLGFKSRKEVISYLKKKENDNF